MIGEEFGGRDDGGKAEDTQDRVSEPRGFLASIEIVVINTGSRDLARETERVDFDDSGDAMKRSSLV